MVNNKTMLTIDKFYERLIIFSFICTFMTLNFLQLSGIQIGDKVIICILCYVVFILEIKNYLKLRVINILPLFIWIGCNIVGTLYSKHKFIAIAFTFNYVIQIALFISFIVLFSNYKVKREDVLKVIYWVAVLIAFIGIIEYFNYDLMSKVLSIFREKQYLYGRVSSMFENPNHFGSFMAVSLTIGMYFLIKEIGKKKFIIGNILIGIGVLFSGSRSAMIVSLIGIFMIIYNLNKYSDFKIKKRYVYLIISVLMIVIILNQEEISRLNLIIDGIKSRDFDMISGNRGIIWSNAISMLDYNPLFGIGNGNVQKEMINYMDQGFGTHSLYISLLVENGIIGFVSFFVFILFSYMKSTNIKDNGLRVIFNSLSVVLLVIQITEMQLTNVFQIVFIFWFVFSIPYDRQKTS